MTLCKPNTITTTNNATATTNHTAGKIDSMTATSSTASVININVPGRSIDVKADLSGRKFEPPARPAAQGVFAKYAALVSSASQGAVTIPNPPPAQIREAK